MARQRVKEAKLAYKNTQVKLKNAMPEALAALQQIIKLMEAAQVPLLGGALFGVASELIQGINGMQSNEETCAVLLQTILDYTKRVDRFISLMPPGFLDDPNDGSARVVRESLEGFRLSVESRPIETLFAGPTLERAHPSIAKHSTSGRLMKFFTQQAAKERLLQFNQQLAAARDGFNDAVRDVNLSVSLTTQRVSDVVPEDDLKIAGAVALLHTSLGTLEPLDEFTPPQVSSFWKDFFKAEVRGEIRAVKVYHKDRGKQDLERDLKILADNMTAYTPQIMGYSQNGKPAFIAFKFLPVMSLVEHLIYIQTDKLEESLVVAWKCLLQLRETGEFLRRNNATMGWVAIQAALEFSAVDSTGKVIVAPDTLEFDDHDWVESWDARIGGFELTKGWKHRLTDNDPRLRRYRPLALALIGNHINTLSISKKVLSDPFSAKRLLRQFWNRAGEGRYLQWPGSWSAAEPLTIGDIGVFAATWENRTVVDGIRHHFRRVGNIITEVGEFEVKDFHKGSHSAERLQAPEVAPYVWRKTFLPSQNHRPFHSYNAQWNTRFLDPDQVWNYWVRNVKSIAREHGIKPEDLILVTETASWSVFYQNDPWTEAEPITAYTYANENGQGWLSYWTYGDKPLLPEDIDDSVGASYEFRQEIVGENYLQLEPEDLENVEDP